MSEHGVHSRTLQHQTQNLTLKNTLMTSLEIMLLCLCLILAGAVWYFCFKGNAYRQQAENASKERATLQARLEEREHGQENVEQKLQAFADRALRHSQRQFLDMANEQMAKQKEGVSGDLRELLKPVQESFGQFRQKVEAIEKTRTEDRTAMLEQIKHTGKMLQQAQTTTSQLTNALSAPKGAGNWGEESLRNVLEMSGASEFCDFIEQAHEARNNGTASRPDVMMRMPGGRKLAIDSKVSLEDYLKASQTPDDQERKIHLSAHAGKIKAHVRILAGREYWQIDEALDFVAMYIPGDHFWSAALEQDRSLFDEAARKRIIIVTPSTLIALAKTIAYGWRQEEMARNAQEIARLGQTLHERLCIMADHMGKTGKSLNTAVDSYNRMIRSLESRVVPQIRKFEELGAVSAKTLPDVPPVDGTAHQPNLSHPALLSEQKTHPHEPGLQESSQETETTS